MTFATVSFGILILVKFTQWCAWDPCRAEVVVCADVLSYKEVIGEMHL